MSTSSGTGRPAELPHAVIIPPLVPFGGGDRLRQHAGAGAVPEEGEQRRGFGGGGAFEVAPGFFDTLRGGEEGRGEFQVGVVLPEAAERILFVQDFGRQNSAVNQLLLKRADRNFPERFALLRRRRRGEARRIPLVLHIGLLADEQACSRGVR